VTSANRFQEAYVELYTCLRSYIWDFETVELISNLEIETYRTFPDVEKMRGFLTKLKREVRATDVLNEDEELAEAFDNFEEIINETDEVYAALNVVDRVVSL
jgi:hypothetical protein